MHHNSTSVSRYVRFWCFCVLFFRLFTFFKKNAKINNETLETNLVARRSGQMISNQVLQSTIEGIKNISRVDICVMDTEGKALATTINSADDY